MALMQSGIIWHSPININHHLIELVSQVGWEAINSEGKYKHVREAKVAMIVALWLYEIRGIPAFVQLIEDDPPDVLIAQQSPDKFGTVDISTVEITTYAGKNGETLLEQLKRTKTPQGYHKYSDRYVITVEIQTDKPIDFDEIREYLNENNTPFPVWTLRPLQHKPNTIGEVTIINPERTQYIVDIGSIGNQQRMEKVPPVIKLQRATSYGQVGTKAAGRYPFPPWHGLIK